MRLLFYIVFLVVFVIGNQQTLGKYETGVQQLINALTITYCPYNDLCQSNASLLLNDNNTSACCDDCSCDSDCWKKGNCCPDKHDVTQQSPTTECQQTLVNGPSNYDMLDRFWVVTKCPEIVTNETLIQKCKGEGLTSLDDYLWVSDPLTNQIYNNKWCAECNSITEFVEWHVAADCVRILNGNYPINDQGIFDKNCNLIVVPPRGLAVTQELCRKPDISTCNRTGKWVEFNASIEKACEAFEQHFYEEYMVGQTIYKNVFCAMCNANAPYDMSDQIDQVCYKRRLIYWGIRDGMGGNMFIGLIDWRFYKQLKSKDNANVCHIDEVEDKFMRKCRKLSCPLLTAPFHGTCKRVMKTSNLLRIRVLYRIKPLLTLSKLNISGMTLQNLETICEEIIRQFELKLGLVAKSCTSCNIGVWAHASNDSVGYTNMPMPAYFIFNIEYLTDNNCKENVIAESLLNLHEEEIQVEDPTGETVTFETSLETQSTEQAFRSTIKVTGRITSVSCFVDSYIDLTKTNLCPTITLTNADYIEIVNKTKTESEINKVNALFGIVNYNGSTSLGTTKTVTICLDTYEAIFSARNVNMHSNTVRLQLIGVHTHTLMAVFVMLSSISIT